MRLRRVVQALLRHRRIDERETSYHDVVWENAMEAYESTPDPEPEISPVVEITPYIQARLDAAKEELLLKAHRTKRQRDLRHRQLRRRAVVLAATAVTVVSGAGGAAALTGIATGIDALDRLLGTLAPPAVNHDVRFPGQPVAGDWRPADSNVNSVKVADSVPPGHVATFYRSERGYLCVATGDDLGASDLKPRARRGCSTPASVFDRLLTDTAYVSFTDMRADGTLLMGGYLAGDVDDVEVDGPFGAVNTSISAPWKPLEGKDTAIRTFLGVTNVDVGEDGLTAGELDRGIDFTAYRIRVSLDGSWRWLTD